MDIRPLPEEIPYVLTLHHEYTQIPNPEYPKSVDGLTAEQLDELPPKELEEQGAPIKDAPVFVYEPLKPRERARWAVRLFNENVDREKRTLLYLDLFAEKIIRVDNLTVNGATFNKNDQAHLEALELSWQTEVAMTIFTTSKLSEEDAGK